MTGKPPSLQPLTVVWINWYHRIYSEKHHKYKTGDDIDIKGLSERLVNAGYENAGQTEHSGQFAIRGGIIDIFPVNMEIPAVLNCGIQKWMQ